MQTFLDNPHFYIVASIFIGVFFLHWIADFVLVPRMTEAKLGCQTKIVLNHVLIYAAFLLPYYILITLFFTIFGKLKLIGLINLVGYQVTMTFINVLSHAVIDFILCPFRERAFQKRAIKRFWAIVGFDQMLHIIILLLTTAYYSHLLFLNFIK